MRNQGIGSWPARRARMSPANVAIWYEDQVTTFAELDVRVTTLAGRLRALGIGRGDRVAYLGPNHPSYLEVLFATGMLGAVFVPLNFRLPVGELDEILVDCAAKIVVYGEGMAEKIAGIDRERCGVRPLACTELDGIGHADLPPDEHVSLEDVCLILYTSGTTGKPKGVMLTHGNLTWNCFNAIVESDVASDERALIVAPLFHAAALGMTCLPVLLKGGTAFLVASFDPDAVLALIERERITMMFGVPTMFEMMASRPRWADVDLSSVRRLVCGGAPVRLTTIRRYLDLGLHFAQGYGLTETAAGVLMLDRAHLHVKAGSVGVPSFFTDVRVVDADRLEAPSGVPGEIMVSGPNVMPGYWGQPEATEEVFEDGWFRTGDVGVVDKDGYFFIVDRIKNVIISGGENVYPAEIEDVLHDMDGIAACVVIGVADDKWGEIGKALVVADPDARITEAAVLAHLRLRLAKYKVPKYVQFVDALPTTASGKIARSEVRRRHGAGEQTSYSARMRNRRG
ncbi:AMP-dependent synthetase [Amycolatopsis regifaucium]|uniref:AMP-dependent synthetase n=1 Tax=Amycolatopsis regifaucium TaxID=546365 RepID=A0A154MFY1_9PSEU|nr:AMP-dependent synthetase [Amycolatopsis regifaucium]OKA03232.1 p-hydroxycinnamoyl-CoA synthetase [Amycolatopsis regifaucium]